MLQIVIPEGELFDEETSTFSNLPKVTLQLEHSLVSLSRWESKWNKAFLGKQKKTDEELFDYVRCMTLTKHVNPSVYSRLTQENMNAINEYIEAPMTATYFPKNSHNPMGGDTVTAELIYYWMVALNIPFECQKWHLNRLMALIRVCSIKTSPPKKMGKKEVMNRNRALNEARRKKLHSKG